MSALDAAERAMAAPHDGCSCCATVPVDGRYSCGCTHEMFCRRCSHCLPHCRCAEVADVDLPAAMWVKEARTEWRKLGVTI